MSKTVCTEYNTMAIEWFNTNSKRSPRPLFFQLENSRNKDMAALEHQSTIFDPGTSFDFDFTFATLYILYKTHTTCVIEFQYMFFDNLEKRKKRLNNAWHCAFC